MIDKDFATVNLDLDTYSMAFKALHTKSAVEMRLIPNVWQRAL